MLSQSKVSAKLNALNLISLKRVERLLYHVQLQSVCSATLNTPKVAIEPKRDKFLFKKLADKKSGGNFYSTTNLTELSGKPNTFWNVSIIP